MNKQNKKGFTFVELIITVTILSILGVIGFISYGSYLAGVRDSNRISQLININDSLSLYLLKSKLPLPDYNIEIRGGSEVLINQGYSGSGVLKEIKFDRGGKDPKDLSFFTYSLNYEKSKFQLMSFLEQEDSLKLLRLNKTPPLIYPDKSLRYPFVIGHKLGTLLTANNNYPIQQNSNILLNGYLDLEGDNNIYSIYFEEENFDSGSGGYILNLLMKDKDNSTNGVCGSSNNQSFSSAPSTNLCSSGSASSVSGSGPWSWTCSGSNGGTNDSCSASISSTNGVCGSSNNQSFSSAPSTNLCSSGSASSVSGSGPWSWTCSGANGGTNDSCTAQVNTVNGVCPTGEYQEYTCGAGSVSSQYETSTYYRRTCSGIGGGTDSSYCYKYKPINGVCSASLNTCSSGTFLDTTDTSSYYNWNCLGSNGGATVSCSNLKPINGNCSIYLNTCNSGTFLDTTDTSTVYKWKCISNNGGNTDYCSKEKDIDGQCHDTNRACIGSVFSNNIPDTATEYTRTCKGRGAGNDAVCSCVKGAQIFSCEP